ncbi:MAG TPA: hypothetical protein VHE53_02410 [Patescibacteria group bacterium]|nr:hypothetical protein [Patescibacteria group bacterium]
MIEAGVFNTLSSFAAPGDRTNCSQITGTQYNSDDERNMYWSKCLGKSAPPVTSSVSSGGSATSSQVANPNCGDRSLAKDTAVYLPPNCRVHSGDLKIAASLNGPWQLNKAGATIGLITTCGSGCYVAPVDGGGLSGQPVSKLATDMGKTGCTGGCATVLVCEFTTCTPYGGSAPTQTQTTTTGSTTSTASGGADTCYQAFPKVPVGYTATIPAGCNVVGDIWLFNGSTYVRTYDDQASTGKFTECPTGCKILAAYDGTNATNRSITDLNSKEGCGSGCKFTITQSVPANPGTMPTIKGNYTGSGTSATAASSASAQTTGTTTTTSQTTSTAAVTYQQPAPSSSASSAAFDPCGGKTKLGPNEEFVLIPGCSTVGSVYFWINGVWADRFSDNPNSTGIGYVMNCPAGPCSIKSGDWTVGLSSKPTAAILQEGCQKPCFTLQYKPVGAYKQGEGPVNTIAELRPWVAYCYNSDNGWNNSTVMKAENGNIGFNVQWDVQADACRLLAMYDAHKLNPDLRLP